MRGYLLNVLIALDVLLNVVCLGEPDETISARAALARAKGQRWGCILCRWLDHLEPDHCVNAIRNDGARAENAETDLGTE